MVLNKRLGVSRRQLLLVVSYAPLSWLFMLPILFLINLGRPFEVSSLIWVGAYALASQFVLPPMVIGWFSNDEAFLNALAGYLIYVTFGLFFLNEWLPRASGFFSSEMEDKLLYFLALLITGVVVALVSYFSSFIKRKLVLR